MLVFHDISEIALTAPSSVVAIGNFDGVHLGHQALVLRCVRTAQEKKCPSVAMTFAPHPAEVLRPGTVIRQLTTTSEKLLRLESLGVDIVLVQRFDTALSQLSPTEFFHQFLECGLRASRIHVGRDFRFGHERAGDLGTLTQLCNDAHMEIETLSEVSFRGQHISSTTIRSCIGNGDLLGANALLGAPYFFSGTVLPGDGRGRQLGFPTVNLSIAPNKILPPNGVYVSRVVWKGVTHRAVVNIGVRPTFGQKNGPTIEAHLLDFKEDLYGEHIRIELFERIREERKFASAGDLVDQIRKDVAATAQSSSLD